MNRLLASPVVLVFQNRKNKPKFFDTCALAQSKPWWRKCANNIV